MGGSNGGFWGTIFCGGRSFGVGMPLPARLWGRVMLAVGGLIMEKENDIWRMEKAVSWRGWKGLRLIG